MKAILALTLALIAVHQIFADDKLECYQCSPVTAECEVDKASVIACGNPNSARCGKRVKIGSSDDSKALRRCEVPDVKTGKILCPDGYNCWDCNEDKCNSGSTVKFTWFSVAGLLFAILRMN